MNDSALKDIANQQMPVYTALRGFINATNYINVGVISKVHSENYVDVNLYYTDSVGRKVVLQAVRLLHIGTTKCKLNIVPAIGDNVLLLCPKDFVEKLIYNNIPRKGKTCYIPYSNINMCGLLIKDEGDTNVKTTININENGDISVETKGNVSVSSNGDISALADGTISLDGDGYGGLCKTPELKDQLDVLSARLDNVIDALKNSQTAAEDGGATYKEGIGTIIDKYMAQHPKEDFSQIESDKVVHGDGSSS